MNRVFVHSVVIGAALFCSEFLQADPCGMVPPIYTGDGPAITRIGLQQTYVYFDKGIESFVIRPGFRGKVDNFGMLIPFPSPPEIRKVSDDIFKQIANAVDPPEVVVDLRPRLPRAAMARGGRGGGGLQFQATRETRQKVTVLKQEAVGMYEVAVLQAGSADALKRWMDLHEYQYPDGMDKVTEDYIEQEWCFVAVKTKVGQKKGVSPAPGQRRVRPELPSNSVFDGSVQGLGFRFQSDELVVPMRLSAFNEGELRNVVYLLTKSGQRIRAIPEEYVVRQIDGKQLVKNLTGLRPLRIIGGTLNNIPESRREQIKKQRDPVPVNGIAKLLFASDLAATQMHSEGLSLSLDFEETEKELLRVGEHLGLRGKHFDQEMSEATQKVANKQLDSFVEQLAGMTLTVVDGDFPRQVIANQNLTFERYQMAAERNSAVFYDAKINGPAQKRQGLLISAADPWSTPIEPASDGFPIMYAGLGMAGMFVMLKLAIGIRKKINL